MNLSDKQLSKCFGFNKDREGLIIRYLKEKNNWESHIQNTKDYILNSAKEKEKGTAVILGSGWWIDIPYQELSELFKKLIFVDITHPNQIKHKVKRFPNIELLTADISGVLGHIYDIRKKNNKIDNLYNLLIDKFNFGLLENIKPDFTVSLNILNQLSFFPKKFLVSNNIIQKVKIEEITKFIEENHINNLPINKSCIIADYFQYEYDFNNKLKNKQSRLKAKLPESEYRKEWIWDFDLSGNFINNRKVKFKVCALQV